MTKNRLTPAVEKLAIEMAFTAAREAVNERAASYARTALVYSQSPTTAAMMLRTARELRKIAGTFK